MFQFFNVYMPYRVTKEMLLFSLEYVSSALPTNYVAGLPGNPS